MQPLARSVNSEPPYHSPAALALIHRVTSLPLRTPAPRLTTQHLCPSGVHQYSLSPRRQDPADKERITPLCSIIIYPFSFLSYAAIGISWKFRVAVILFGVSPPDRIQAKLARLATYLSFVTQTIKFSPLCSSVISPVILRGFMSLVHFIFRFFPCSKPLWSKNDNTPKWKAVLQILFSLYFHSSAVLLKYFRMSPESDYRRKNWREGPAFRKDTLLPF